MRATLENRPAPDCQRRSGIPAFRRVPGAEEKRMLRNDLSRRAEILGESLQESVDRCSSVRKKVTCKHSLSASASANI